MKNKLLIFIICILIIIIGTIQFYNFNNSKIKSSISAENSQNVPDENNISLLLPEIKNIELVKIPVKKNSAIDPNIYAKNYILIDEKSMYPLIEKDSHVRVPIASTTKIMTAILTLENYNLEDVIEISEKASSQIGSDVYLRLGEKIKVKDLLYALLLKSGNDSAMALAEHMDNGGEAQFIKLMNEKAQYLSLKDTEFKDSAGLDDNGRSSAYDLSVIASYALKIPLFREIIKTHDYTITSIDGQISHPLESSNRLIKSDEPLYMESAIGVKTGYTPDAGHCLVSAAFKNNNLLIGVILNTNVSTNDASAKESKKMLEWGYDSFEF